ncbi:ABC transporter substrate-binding protein [Agromyces aerolatus]|uniref:ABC transporter substrate-binding protein n=1 Tax=Agromyces sp. LY-1074 TaxID=3074080 RepID=UPI0028545095|nr:MULTISPECIES: extracellular solute-binding protein [unclassified Agromyces]MDR5700195.1 extracellular solute-binding protein [Agromyces sp. LY-1074]MDR5706437.1 extracellular solute-binding protein [Agromyces sp. LY-1358]
MALGAAAVLALGACSGGTGGSESGGDQELVLWHMEGTPNRVAAFESLAEKYNETDPEYPVTVQVQDWDQVYTKIAGAAQSGKQPDILFAIPDFATYVRNLGLGQPVTEVVDTLDSDYGLIDAAKAPYQDEDEYWAVPLYGMVQMLWYREDKLAEAGIEAPTTWSELVAAAQALTTDGTSGIALPAGKNLATDQVLYSLMITGGAANFFTEDGQVDIDTPETVAAFEVYKELLQYSPTDSANYAWGEPQAALNSGAAAMAIEKGQYLAPFAEESGLDPSQLGCAPIPVADDGGEPGSIYYSNGAMVLSDDEAKQAGAGEFLEWLLEPENYGDFLNAEPGLFLPVTTDGAELEQWRSNEVLTTYAECVDAMLEQSETGELFGFVDGQYIDTIGEISGQNFLAQAVQQMYVNGMTAEEAAAWAQEQMQAAIG